MKKTFSILVLLSFASLFLAIVPIAAADECNGVVDKGCSQTSCGVIWHRDTWPDGYSEWNHEETCTKSYCKFYIDTQCIG